MDWNDPPEEALPDAEADTRPPVDLAGMLLSANGFLVVGFGTLLLLTPVGDGQRVDAPDFGTIEALGIIGIGLALIASAVWRRDRKVLGPVVGAAGLLGSVACLAVMNVGLMAVCPTLGLLALVNRPLPAVPEA